MNSYLAVMHEIHVLVVDHEFNGVMNTTRLLLETCQYIVTHVELASDGIAILKNGEVKFDFVIADFNSPDLHAVKLLELAVRMGIPMILMSVEYDINMATRVMELGAFLYIKRPTTPEMFKCLWQHVAQEKMRVMMRERERHLAASYATPPPPGIEFYSDENPNHVFQMKESAERFKRKRVEEEYYGMPNNMSSQGKIKRKICTEWTRELHQKFMDAIHELGEGRCFPKEILDLMNVPGLTRMQVASHLQKCRNDNWRTPEERKSTSGTNPMPSDSEGSSHKPRRFGAMPRLVKSSPATSDYQVYEQGSGQGLNKVIIQSEPAVTGNERVETINQSSYHHHQQHQQHQQQQQQQQQHYGALLPPHPNIINSSNFGHHQLSSSTTDAAAAFFASDMDCMIQNLSATTMPPPSIFAGMNQPPSNSRVLYHFHDDHHVHNHDQTNSKGAVAASMGSTSPWSTSSEASNDFELTTDN